MKLLEIQNPYKKYLNLTWIINNICTHKCTYCTPSLYAGKNHNYDWNHAEQFLDTLLEKYPLVNLSLSGGEPTLSPFLLELVKKINENNGTVSISTNGSASLRKYLELANYIQYFSFSYHPEYHNDEWIDKLTAISEVARVHVRVMSPASHYDISNNFFQKLKSNHRNFSYEKSIIVDRGQLNKNTIVYSQEQLTEIQNETPYIATPDQNKFLAKILTKKDSPLTANWIGSDSYYTFDQPREQVIQFFNSKHITSNDLIKNNFVNFKDWSCDIGLESLFVNYDGSIKRGNCNVGGIIGRIQDLASISWPTESIICDKQFGICDCNVDVRISKRY